MTLQGYTGQRVLKGTGAQGPEEQNVTAFLVASCWMSLETLYLRICSIYGIPVDTVSNLDFIFTFIRQIFTYNVF